MFIVRIFSEFVCVDLCAKISATVIVNIDNMIEITGNNLVILGLSDLNNEIILIIIMINDDNKVNPTRIMNTEEKMEGNSSDKLEYIFSTCFKASNSNKFMYLLVNNEVVSLDVVV